MTQQEIIELLQTKTDYLTSNEIANYLKINLVSVRRCLRSLRKRHEISFIICHSPNKQSGQLLYKYKISEEK